MKPEKSLQFLAQLKENNYKEWMDDHKADYTNAKNEFKEVIKETLNRLGAIDPDFLGLESKDCIFRINRDIRFSKDKSPYKQNFGAFMTPGGKKSELAGFYLHLQPGDESFIGGGLYMPAGEILKKIRQEIDYNAAELKKIVEEKKFIKLYDRIQGEKLKTAPRGYPLDHPNIELLKMKSYVVINKIADSDLMKHDIVNLLEEHFKVAKPFFDYLNVAIS